MTAGSSVEVRRAWVLAHNSGSPYHSRGVVGSRTARAVRSLMVMGNRQIGSVSSRLTRGNLAMNTYVVWNNKGGVGKSTITFNLSARYAELNPMQSVLVIDMCPQANVTMTLLGGGLEGEEHLLQLQT